MRGTGEFITRLATTVVCVVLMACGARSSLRVGPGERPVGPGPATGGGGGAGGFGGGGGNPVGGAPTCADGVDMLHARSFSTLPDHVARKPQLIATSLDGLQVTMLVRADEDPPLIDGNSLLTQVTFSPWGAWPEAVLGDEVFLFSGSVATAVPRTREVGISALTSYATFATGPGVTAIMQASTDVEAPPDQQLTTVLGVPQFMTGRSEIQQNWGFGIVSQSSTANNQGILGTVKQAVFTLHDAGCDPVLLMDGLRTEEGFIAATWEGCISESASLKILMFDDTGVLSEQVHSTHSGALEQIYMLPRSDGGAWMLYQPPDEPLLAQHVAAEGAPIGVPWSVIEDPFIAREVKDRVAVADVGNGIAIAYFETGGEDQPPSVELRVFSPAGDLLVNAVLELPAPPSVGNRLSLIASPGGDSLLIAWASDELIAGVSGGARSFVARLDCLSIE
jgi:hypothetical protein